MTKAQKPPRWTLAFLRALERCGDARRSARDAGIDHTTAYHRRQTHPDFADAWAAALVAFVANEKRHDHRAAAPRFERSAAAAPAGQDLMLQPGADRARVARSGEGRWTAAAEKRFFAALADRANVRAAAAAAGFSTNAIYARRARRPEFRRQWEAAVETGKARLHLLLMDTAERAFDPALLEVSEEAPEVSVAEALNILKAREGKEKEVAASAYSWSGDPPGDPQEDYQEACERVIERLARLRERDDAEHTAAGWVQCPEHNMMIPPGWVRDPDYVAPPPEPDNLCEGERLGLTYRPPSG